MIAAAQPRPVFSPPTGFAPHPLKSAKRNCRRIGDPKAWWSTPGSRTPAREKKGSGAHNPGKEKVGKVTRKQAEEIAKTKMPDMTAGSLEAAMRTVEGTARSMGIEIVG